MPRGYGFEARARRLRNQARAPRAAAAPMLASRSRVLSGPSSSGGVSRWLATGRTATAVVVVEEVVVDDEVVVAGAAVVEVVVTGAAVVVVARGAVVVVARGAVVVVARGAVVVGVAAPGHSESCPRSPQT